ncbi:hypothetical protein [Duganella vulcania]|uniref:Uncharacterized protein n=1 Tax=Duganella vulcania TaxID=2692166 RepID=A0A845GZT4_9BURK|nr:hypothetical protein [Duganella vulcania]MYM97979.1 hypothetical protein [Duganella vulcania]
MRILKQRWRQQFAIVENDMVTYHFGEFNIIAVVGSQTGSVGKEDILPLKTSRWLAVSV